MRPFDLFHKYVYEIPLMNKYWSIHGDTQPSHKEDPRLHAILDMIGKVAALDFSTTLSTSDRNDMVDAIAVGLNMLSEELNTSVVEKSKLDEVNTKLEKFAYTTAHDLKSPLNSIAGIVNLLELTIRPNATSEVADYLQRLKATVDKMKNLVQGILEYSKADAEKIERIETDLNKVFFEIVETDQFLQEVKVKIIGLLPVVFFNRSAIYQIFRNLISNAVKYSDKEVCELQIESTEMKDHYLISINDNGPGIAPENHDEIFKLFNKTSTTKIDSHGVGLAMIKRILEASGERIWVESSLGNGATFFFTIKRLKTFNN